MNESENRKKSQNPHCSLKKILQVDLESEGSNSFSDIVEIEEK